MAGTHDVTGQVITGWPEVAQSLRTILSTPKGSRVMRRDFGCDHHRLLDRPGNAITIVEAFAAIVEAIEPRTVNGQQYGEPRFDLVRIAVTRAEAGRAEFELAGLYYPRGHLGDFSAVEVTSGRVVVEGSA